MNTMETDKSVHMATAFWRPKLVVAATVQINL